MHSLKLTNSLKLGLVMLNGKVGLCYSQKVPSISVWFPHIVKAYVP